jgi:hypothetical protein
MSTGETVAVKQIRLIDVPKSELRSVEAEIDLLKNLHVRHPRLQVLPCKCANLSSA